MVIDTSALLAVLFNDKHGPWVVDQLAGSSSPLRMSTVNYAETLILVEDRQPNLIAAVREMIAGSSILLTAPGAQEAEIAASARLRFPLNLGDCFAYALAKRENSPLLTLDRDFRRTDITVVLP